MKTRTMLVTLALFITAAANCFADNPHMGAWKLNEAKSKMPPGMGKNTDVIYAADGDNTKVTVNGVDKDGKPTHSIWVGKFDGKSYPVEGNLPYNAVTYTAVDDHTNNITAMKDGKVYWTGTITVSKDGKSRSVTVNGTDAEGKKFSGEVVYDKQ